MSQEINSIIKELGITNETTIQVVSEIQKVIKKVYPDSPIKQIFEPNASTHAMLPGLGLNPIDLIQVYETKDHIGYVTMFFGPKAGYELSFRIQNNLDLDSDYVKNLLSHITCSILSDDFKIDLFIASILYLPSKYQTKEIKAVLVFEDPLLEPEEISIGKLKYRIIFGIDQATYERITNKDGQLLTDPLYNFYDQEAEKNPKFITGVSIK